MICVGLTGGYATGKSFVAAELARLGCHLIYADKLGHKVLEPGHDAYQPTVEVFGPRIIDRHGRIDRRQLGAIVFSSPELLQKLNAIVHPAVFHLEEQMMESLSKSHPHGITVVEAAILIETGRFTVFDRLILTSCDEALQIARGIERDHLDESQIHARLKEQMPLSEKRKHADYVVDTGATPAETLEQVRAIYKELQTLASRSTN